MEQRLSFDKRTLQDTGLRATASRLQVLRLMRQSSQPLSHGEVVQALSEESFDRATLYRNLMDLYKAGLLVRSDYGDHVWRFQLHRPDEHKQSNDEHQHPHFVCEDCKQMICLDGVEVPLSSVSNASIAKVSEIVLRGQCNDCE